MYLTQSRGKHFYTICPSYYKVRSNLLQFPSQLFITYREGGIQSTERTTPGDSTAVAI